jgi:Tectonin domain
METLTCPFSISRMCLIANLLLVDLIPHLVEAKEGPGNIWGVNAKNQIFTWSGNGWRQVAGELKNISAGSDGTVWGVNSRDEIFRWTGNSFMPVPNGSLNRFR